MQLILTAMAVLLATLAAGCTSTSPELASKRLELIAGTIEDELAAIRPLLEPDLAAKLSPVEALAGALRAAASDGDFRLDEAFTAARAAVPAISQAIVDSGASPAAAAGVGSGIRTLITAAELATAEASAPE